MLQAWRPDLWPIADELGAASCSLLDELGGHGDGNGEWLICLLVMLLWLGMLGQRVLESRMFVVVAGRNIMERNLKFMRVRDNSGIFN